MKAECLIRKAQRRSGLEDFGRPPLEPALSTLLTSLKGEANLHLVGRLLMGIHLRDLLETRLRLAAVWREKQADLEAERIERPTFIIGMPRSGSTFLHELLTESPERRAPRVWEVMSPLPSGGGEREARWRIRKAEFCLWWFRHLAPRANAVYPMRALTPHECVAIHSYTFLSEEFVSTCRVPSYKAFLHAADRTPAYVWQKRFLQHLQLGCPSQRWVLKSPDHVHGLKALFAVFPDAVVIHTHRNPVEVLQSATELTRVLQGLYAPREKPEAVQAREAKVIAEGMQRSIHFRDAHPELANRFLDVKYTELIADPVGMVRRICQWLDSPLREPAVERVRHLALNRSRYSGRRARVEPAALEAAFAPEADQFEHYCLRFGLSPAPAKVKP